MSESNIKQCPICGEYLKDKSNEMYCDCCGFKIAIDEISSYDMARLNTAHDALRNYKFDVAEETYSLILTDSEDGSYTHLLGLWGKLLSSFGIVYIKDMNGLLIPTFTEYNPNIKSIKESEIYSLISKSKCSKKKEYLEKVDELENIYKKIREELASKCEYDLFICTKISRKTTRDPNRDGFTLDSKIADEFYYTLKDSKLKVFYSQKDCKGIEYDSQILSALLKSKKILIIATEKEYLESPWVQSEWRRWLSFIECGIKESDSIYLYLPHYDKDSFELPRALRKVQRFTTELQVMNALGKKPEKIKKIEPKTSDDKSNKYKEILDKVINNHKEAVKNLKLQKGDYVYFGYYPQTKKKKGVMVTKDLDDQGRFFKGVDGSLYKRLEDDYYKVEPIKWKVLYHYENKMLLISDKVIDTLACLDCDTVITNMWYMKDYWVDGFERSLIDGEVSLLTLEQFKNSLKYFDRFKSLTDYSKAQLPKYKGWILKDISSNLFRKYVTKSGKINEVMVRDASSYSGERKVIPHPQEYGIVPVIELNLKEIKDIEFNSEQLHFVKNKGLTGKIVRVNVKVGDIVKFTDVIAQARDSNLSYEQPARQSGIVLEVNKKASEDAVSNENLATIYVGDIFKK